MATKVIIPSSAYLKRITKELKSNSRIRSRNAPSSGHKERTDHIHNIIKNSPTNNNQIRKRSGIKAHALEHLSVFIMDEEDINEEYLRQELDAEIHDNFIVSSVAPVHSSPEDETTLPEFWHKDKLKVSESGLTGKGIVVGVLDSGIYAEHQEFDGKSIVFAHFDKDGKLVDDQAKDFGTHGTHVCGLLAGKNAGIAPDASLVVAAVLTENGGTAGYLGQILGGLNWLLGGNSTEKNTGVHLINASIESASGFNDYLYSTLETAQTNPGTLMIAAIGNNGSKGVNSDTSPGNYNLTLGVGALDQDDNVASFSAWGTVSEMDNISKPDLSAPGVYLYSSLPGVPGNRYFKQSGTSMASPVVCGVAALLLEDKPDLIFQPDVLKSNLINTVVPISDTERGGKGRVNIVK